MKNATRMVEHVDQYLAVRRALGVQLTIAGQQLLAFARFADEIDPGKPLSVELALRWAQASARSTPIGPARRLEIVRPFARYLSSIDADTEIPSRGLLGPAHRRVRPHIYSDQELQDLLEAAARLGPQDGLRPQTVRTYLGLLLSTGMRPNEPLGLSRDDVDLHSGIITIRKTKFSKSRLVVLHTTVTRALQSYMRMRDSHVLKPTSSAFFLVDNGGPFTHRKALTAFDRLRRQLGWAPSPRQRCPRLYDVRHTFACRRLLSWYREGIDIHVAIPALSTYLGHVKVTDTYWYLTGVPELMAIASSRFEHFAVPEEE